MAQEWTDGQLELRAEFTELRAEMKEGFARIDDRLDGIQKTMIYGALAITSSMTAGFAATTILILAKT